MKSFLRNYNFSGDNLQCMLSLLIGKDATCLCIYLPDILFRCQNMLGTFNYQYNVAYTRCC